MTLADLGHKSVRRNTLIADLLHRIEFIEKAGTGIKRTRDEAHDQGCPEPAFESNLLFTATFRPNPEVRAQAGAQRPERAMHKTGTKSAPSQHQVAILMECLEEQPLVALMALAGRSDRTKFRNQVLAPLLAGGLLELTVPDKPRSSKQRYRITAEGRDVLNRRKKES